MKAKSFLRAAALATGISLAAAVLMACSNDEPATTTGSEHSSHEAATNTDLLLRENMRTLWNDHVTWTRLAIVSIAGNLDDATATTERLLQNQVDIGDAIKPYYGAEAGDQLTALLQDHIVIAANLVAAARDGDSATVDQEKARWYVNGDEIGAFLGAANPDHWDAAEMQSMMREHLDLTLQEAVLYLTDDHEGSVAVYDEIHRQILGMSDMLSDGIIAQFPDSFTAQGNGR